MVTRERARPPVRSWDTATSTMFGMNAAVRRALGWIAAVLLNVGALLFVVGLIVPRAGGTVALPAVGVALLIAGLVVGAAWFLSARERS